MGQKFGAPGRTRTPDPRLRRPSLYPAELPGQRERTPPIEDNVPNIVRYESRA